MHKNVFLFYYAYFSQIPFYFTGYKVKIEKVAGPESTVGWAVLLSGYCTYFEQRVPLRF
jgi:hypothetical protein